jgi:hypothetical protein
MAGAHRSQLVTSHFGYFPLILFPMRTDRVQDAAPDRLETCSTEGQVAGPGSERI